MSLYSLRGSGAKFYRHAFILAHKTNVQPHKFSRSPASTDGTVRQAHNGLYDMVKKRTLEARAKMNQQPVDQNPLANQKLNQSPASNSSHTSSTTNFHSASPLSSPFPSFAKGVKTGPNKDIAAVADVCQNTKVLGATGCQPVNNSKSTAGGPCKPRSAPAGCGDPQPPKSGFKDPEPCKKLPNPCPPKGDKGDLSSCGTGGAGGAGGADGAGDGKSSGGSSCDEKKTSGLTKALYALLAALGVGGLWYLLSSGKGDDDKKKSALTGTDEDCLASDRAPLKPTIPSDSAALPKCVPYLLIGGGTAAFTAFRSIKTHDPRAKILMITNEHHKPYMRPPLSKELWYSAKSGEPTQPDFRFKTWTGSERSIFFEPEEFFVDPSKLMENPNGGISVAHGFTVKKIDPAKHKVTLHDGYEIAYEKCLIATAEHQKLDWPIHKDFCRAVQRVLSTYNVKHPLALQGEPTNEQEMKESIQLLKMLLPIALKRKLQPHEQELTSFPAFCAVCYSLKRSQYTCTACYGVSYCSLEHAKQHAIDHHPVCPMFQLYYCIYKVMPLQAENAPFHTFLQPCSKQSFKNSDLIEAIEYLTQVPMPKVPTASIKDYQHFAYVAEFSAVGTICYALAQLKTAAIEEDNITIFIIGATDEEVHYFRGIHTRFFFLHYPKIKNLTLCYIGPEVVQDSGTNTNTYSFLGSARVVHHITYRGMFQDYMKGYEITPALIIAFNCGFSEFPFSNDSKEYAEKVNHECPWYNGLCKLASTHLIPIFFTSYTYQEAEADYSAFMKVAKDIDDKLCIDVCRILNLIQNPFRDIRPLLNWETTDKEKIFYRNGYIQGVITEIKERERFI